MKVFPDYPHFTPDYSPREMFSLGIYGGCYFRPIYSAINKKEYKNAHKEFEYLKNYSFGETYDVKKNYYGAKSGQTLEYWEEKGWIQAQDPYGWIQWYARFYEGRRTIDDERQISRWKGVRSRFGRRTSPAIKQLLLQWAIDWSKV